MARPTKYRKDFHPTSFVELSKGGKTLAQIAKQWDLDRDTLHAWRKKYPEFSDAIKRGREFAEAWYMDLGHAAMLGQAKINGAAINVNLGWFVYLTKNMFNWADARGKDAPEKDERAESAGKEVSLDDRLALVKAPK